MKKTIIPTNSTSAPSADACDLLTGCAFELCLMKCLSAIWCCALIMFDL